MSDSKIPNPAYCIETKRLIVRCYHPADAKLLELDVTEETEACQNVLPVILTRVAELRA